MSIRLRRASSAAPGSAPLGPVTPPSHVIWISWLEHYADVVLAPNAAVVDPDVPLIETLDAMIASFTNADRPSPPGCLLARLQHASGLGPAVSARVDALRQQARNGYAELIERAKARGDISNEIPTEAAAAMIDIECNAVLSLMAAGEDPDLLRSQARLAFSIFS